MKQICLEETYMIKMTELVIDLNCPTYRGKDKDVWIDGDEAMQLLKISSKTTFQKYRDEDRIIYSKLSEKHFLYYRPSIESYIEKSKNISTWK